MNPNVPSGATTGPLIITNATGRFTNSSPFYLPPVITGFSTNSGRPGTNFVITGTNFTGASSVLFAGTGGAFTVPASNTVLSNLALSVTVPVGAVSGQIRVITTPSQHAESTASFKLQPSVFSFSPGFGNVGTNVTITGANLNEGLSSVTFNGAGASLGTPTFGQVTVTVAGSPTSGPVSVTTSNGTFVSTNFYLPPFISGFTPSNSPPGTTVTLTGSNFTNATQVTFGGLNATNFVTNNTIIGAVVPIGVLTGPIAVTAPGGSISSAGLFYGAPGVSSFSPTHGLPGNNVLISGSNFLGTTAVKFNGTNASFVVTNNTTIGAKVPTNAQTGPITVIAPAGTNITAASFVLDYTNDITVTASAAPEPVTLGGNLVYTIVVANVSPYPAPNVQFTNMLPDFVKLVGSSASFSLDTSTNPVLGNVGTMTANSTATVTLTVSPQTGGFITNTASAGGGFNDPNLANNSTNLVSTVVMKLRAFRTRTNTVVIGWPAPSTGVNLFQNTNLASTNWVGVTNIPVPTYVTNAVTTNENQVILIPQPGGHNFRLKVQ
jgi:hypothetical protein